MPAGGLWQAIDKSRSETICMHRVSDIGADQIQNSIVR